VSGCQNSVHATSGGHNSNVGAGTTKVGDNDDLVLDLGLGAGIVSKDRSDGVGDQLENLNLGLLGGADESLALLLTEVCGYRDDGRCDLLAQVVCSGSEQTAQVANRDFGDGNSRSILLTILVLDGERYGALSFLGVGGGMAVCGVDGLESTRVVDINAPFF
jgi:hypothetical protein